MSTKCQFFLLSFMFYDFDFDFFQFPQEIDKVKSPKVKSPKAKTPSPKAKTPSPKAVSTPGVPASSNKRRLSAAVTAPANHQTSTVSGRFSVSHISTPLPVSSGQEAAAMPTVPLRRKSMKSVSRNQPKSTLKNAVEILRRRSSVSRASVKSKSPKLSGLANVN